MASGIYAIENQIDGKRYIGSAVDLVARQRHHRRHLLQGRHKNRLLQAAWAKDGAGAFRFKTLLVCAREDLLFYEQRAIDGYGAAIDGYNLHPIAGSFLGFKRGPFTAEHRAKLRAARKGRVFPARTPEQLERQSQAVKASWARGQRKPPAPPTPERGARISAALMGKKLSPEHRAKMAAAIRPPHTLEYRQKIAALQTGRKLSAAHCAAIKAAWAKRKAAPCL